MIAKRATKKVIEKILRKAEVGSSLEMETSLLTGEVTEQYDWSMY